MWQAVFGPSRTALGRQAVRWTDVYLSHLPDTPTYLFPLARDPSKPLGRSAYTKMVKAVWLRHTGVALCPKASRCPPFASAACLSPTRRRRHLAISVQDLRSSFVTWLKEGSHSDETVRTP